MGRKRDIGRKYLSGHEKKIRKKKSENIDKEFKGSLLKYFKQDEKKGTQTMDVTELEQEDLLTESNEECSTSSQSTSLQLTSSQSTSLQETSSQSTSSKSISSQGNQQSSIIDLHDPGFWPEKITEQFRMEIIRNGMVQLKGYNYPKDRFNRSFSDKHFTRTLKNGLQQERRWLLYSKEKDSVFCFSCRLFCPNDSALCSDGFNDWTHLSERLHTHENSKGHFNSMFQLIELEKHLKSGTTIDKIHENHVQQRIQFLTKVFERLIQAILFMSKNNLAFRGSNDKLYEPHNGIFLSLIEYVGKFDPVMNEHLKYSKKSYLSPKIQNQLIIAMARKVRSEIISKIKEARYFSILLDCTPDASHQEQLSIVFRYVDVDDMTNGFIHERFLQFESVEDTTGKGLTAKIESILKDEGLDLANCRGQSYDNGANMRGVNKGVQALILEKNPKAYYMSCGSHNLNLILSEMSKSSNIAISFFGTLQSLYNIFAGSVNRWRILKEHVNNLTPKPLSETRWECRINSVKAVRFQLLEFSKALESLENHVTESKIKSEIDSIKNKISSIEFIFSLIIWYRILEKVNIVSKLFQKFRDEGFDSSLAESRELARRLDINPEFKDNRIRKKKRFDSEGDDEPKSSPEDRYRIDYFLIIIDQALESFRNRFQYYRNHHEMFGPFYDSDRLKSLSESELDTCGRTIASVMGEDIECSDLVNEIRLSREVLPSNLGLSQTLKYFSDNHLLELYPNLVILLRILSTLPITVASAERSFSKLKLIKTYLRSTIGKDRFNALALLSIEQEFVNNIDFSDLAYRFAVNQSKSK
uniref:Zinc finger MYM-type protein 1-like n=1 Tax=Dermatophagoides pteronyssinus TaxID=6956 RepID=A0A6P6Y8L0_DERPT|nr:zinc finger MYM-type protein 1-like [Dermatophagoides pteronyssinus]